MPRTNSFVRACLDAFVALEDTLKLRLGVAPSNENPPCHNLVVHHPPGPTRRGFPMDGRRAGWYNPHVCIGENQECSLGGA